MQRQRKIKAYDVEVDDAEFGAVQEYSTGWTHLDHQLQGGLRRGSVLNVYWTPPVRGEHFLWRILGNVQEQGGLPYLLSSLHVGYTDLVRWGVYPDAMCVRLAATPEQMLDAVRSMSLVDVDLVVVDNLSALWTEDPDRVWWHSQELAQEIKAMALDACVVCSRILPDRKRLGAQYLGDDAQAVLLLTEPKNELRVRVFGTHSSFPKTDVIVSLGDR